MLLEVDKYRLLNLIEDVVDKFHLIDVFTSHEDVEIFCHILEGNLKNRLSKRYSDIFDYVYNKFDIGGL